VKRQCAPLVTGSVDEKRSSTADYVKGGWHLSPVWVSRAAVEKNRWRAVSRRDSRRKQSQCADWQQPEHFENKVATAARRVCSMCRMRQDYLGRRYIATGSGHGKQDDAKVGVGSGNADSRPSRTVCCRETRVERARLVRSDDEPALGVAGGKLRRQASTQKTGTTEGAVREKPSRCAGVRQRNNIAKEGLEMTVG
jgi:hypothetical protein